MAAQTPGKYAKRGIEIPYPTLFPLRIPNLSPIKTRNPAPAGNFNSRLPPPQFWAQIPNITAKICRMPHYVLLTKEGYIYIIIADIVSFRKRIVLLKMKTFGTRSGSEEQNVNKTRARFWAEIVIIRSERPVRYFTRDSCFVCKHLRTEQNARTRSFLKKDWKKNG